MLGRVLKHDRLLLNLHTTFVIARPFTSQRAIERIELMGVCGEVAGRRSYDVRREYIVAVVISLQSIRALILSIQPLQGALFLT